MKTLHPLTGGTVCLFPRWKLGTKIHRSARRITWADVRNHRVLGKIDKVDYFEHQNHRDVQAFWDPQSSVCIVENHGRYGADSISALEINDSSFSQTEIGDRIQKSLDAAMKKQAHTEMGGYDSPYFRFGTDRRIRVRALSQNNPKQFDDVKTCYALFQDIRHWC